MFNLQSFWAPALTVTLAACGARFTAHESDDAPTGNAGEASGGFTSAAGSSNVADGGTGTGAGGARNWGNGNWWSSSGGATAADCATLRQQYQASIEAARSCDEGSTNQCSASSVAQPVDGCSCPVPINTQSVAGDATRKAYQAYLDARCEYRGPSCELACPSLAGAYCAHTAGGFACMVGELLK